MAEYTVNLKLAVQGSKELDKLNELLKNDMNDSKLDSNCGKCNRNDGTCGCGKVKDCTLDKCVHPTCNTDETSK